MSTRTPHSGHSVNLLQGGVSFFPALVKAIDQGNFEVRLETFIFHFESSDTGVAEALERAAGRGLAVYLVMDGIGTPDVPKEWQTRFATAGVQWHRFSPLGPVGLLNPVRWRRLHRKLCVVDQEIAFCGGINIVDDCIEPGHGALDAPRYDFALEIQGPLVADIWRTMSDLWGRLQISQDLRQLHFKAAGATWRGRKAPSKIATLNQGQVAPNNDVVSQDVSASLVLRDNFKNRTKIERAYRQAIASAQHEIIIANAYFLPGRRLRRALAHARSRGVKVRVLLQGRYDNFMQFHASRPMTAGMLGSGIEIYEYSTSLLHAKVCVIDAKWATVGSSNLDPLSLLLAREANVVFHHAPLAMELRNCLVKAIEANAVPLDSTRLGSRSRWHQFLDWVAFGLMRLTLFLTGYRY